MIVFINYLLALIFIISVIFLVYNYFSNKQKNLYIFPFFGIILSVGIVLLLDLFFPNQLPISISNLVLKSQQTTISTVQCTDKNLYGCGQTYYSTANRQCIGNRCSEGQSCKNINGQYQCQGCLSINQACKTNSDCCSNNCSNGICQTDNLQLQSCQNHSDCGWYYGCYNNQCTLGKKIYFFLGTLIIAIGLIIFNFYKLRRWDLFTYPSIIAVIIILYLVFLGIAKPGIISFNFQTLALGEPQQSCLNQPLYDCGDNYKDPSGQNCLGIACPQGQSCQNNSCKNCLYIGALCNNNSQCCSGFCNNGQCSKIPSKAITKKLGSKCSSNNDCLENYTCLDGVCKYLNPYSICETDQNCPDGFTCQKAVYYNSTDNNNCQKYPNYILNTLYDGDYPTNKKLCIPTEKVCYCSSNADCPHELYCNTNRRNFCSLGLPGNPCDKDEQCKSGICHSKFKTCTSGAIGESCAKDNDCLEYLDCQSGLCQVK